MLHAKNAVECLHRMFDRAGALALAACAESSVLRAATEDGSATAVGTAEGIDEYEAFFNGIDSGGVGGGVGGNRGDGGGPSVATNAAGGGGGVGSGCVHGLSSDDDVDLVMAKTLQPLILSVGELVVSTLLGSGELACCHDASVMRRSLPVVQAVWLATCDLQLLVKILTLVAEMAKDLPAASGGGRVGSQAKSSQFDSPLSSRRGSRSPALLRVPEPPTPFESHEVTSASEDEEDDDSSGWSHMGVLHSWCSLSCSTYFLSRYLRATYILFDRLNVLVCCMLSDCVAGYAVMDPGANSALELLSDHVFCSCRVLRIYHRRSSATRR